MARLAKNQTEQTKKIYQITFDLLHIYSTKRNLKSYWKDMNGTIK